VKPNDFVRWMLLSPLHGLLGNTMLITVTGRCTGRQITTPVSYIRHDGMLWIISSRDRQWWRNVVQKPDVSLQLNGRQRSGSAQLVTDESAVAARLAAHVRPHPAAARGLHLRMRNGLPEPQDVQRLARERLFVGICLHDQPR
jgi:deazaflavin-dependent oxidoreductase (nitroreductase family)